jgi:hypothetical protein
MVEHSPRWITRSFTSKVRERRRAAPEGAALEHDGVAGASLPKAVT